MKAIWQSIKSLVTWPVYLAFLAYIVRAYPILTTAIWYDESFTWHQSRLTVDQLMAVARLDFTPPLWELMQHNFQHSPPLLYGPRLLSLTFGLYALYVAWEFMKAIYLPRALRIVALAVMAILPGLIWTAQDARGYAFFGFLYITGALFSVRANWAGLFLANLCLFFTHATAPVYVIALAIFALYEHREDWKAIAFVTILPGLFYLPWLLVLMQRTHDYWQTALTMPQFLYALVMAFFVNAFTNEWAALGVSLLIVITFGLACFSRICWRVGILVITPLAGMIIFSMMGANVILYRTLMPLLIPFIIFALSIFVIDRRPWKLAFAALWVLVLVACFVTYNPYERGGHLDAAARLIEYQWRQGDVLYLGAGTALPFVDYLPGKPAYILDEMQHPALLNRQVGLIFGMKYTALEQIPHTRAWIIIPDDILLSPAARARLDGYIHGARLVATVHYWQAANIDVYLQEDK